MRALWRNRLSCSGVGGGLFGEATVYGFTDAFAGSEDDGAGGDGFAVWSDPVLAAAGDVSVVAFFIKIVEYLLASLL